MRIGRLQFRPGVPAMVAALFGLALFSGLGTWQLQRAGYKERVQQVYAAQTSREPVRLDEAADDDNYLPVRVQGRYLPQRTLLLDNQIRVGRAGVHVYTPFVPADGGAAILVNRGWVPWTDRRRMPSVEVDGDRREVLGRLGQPANPGIRLGPASVVQGWPLPLTYIDYGELETVLELSLRSAVLLLDPGEPDGFERDWRPDFGGFGPERHRGYAVQWFALALAVVVILVVTGTRRMPEPPPRGDRC